MLHLFVREEDKWMHTLNRERKGIFGSLKEIKNCDFVLCGTGKSSIKWTPITFISRNILKLTAYFKLGECIGFRKGRGVCLNARNEKHAKLVQILISDAEN
jgi:putative methionine-R-sulfoxide reductase with GAF domain